MDSEFNVNLSRTLSQADLDSFLTRAQQESFLRLKKRGMIADEAMDAFLSSHSTNSKEAIDATLCSLDFIFFCENFFHIKDSITGGWIPFRLWPIQRQMAGLAFSPSKSTLLENRRRIAIPKTRRIGATWLWLLAIPAWLAIYKPNQKILLYSLRERTADLLLSEERFRGSWSRIPGYVTTSLLSPDGVKMYPIGGGSNRRTIRFTNGSVISSMNPKEGDSEGAQYTAIDEADFFPELDATMSTVDPATQNATLVLVSRVNKRAGGKSYFQGKVIDSVENKHSEWESVFAPWYSNPTLNKEWYNQQLEEHSIDYMYSNYPASLEEALAPMQEDKRIPASDLQKCRGDAKEIERHGYINGIVRHRDLKVFRLPVAGEEYFIGADTAQGTETSDNSSTFVINGKGEDVANITGKIHPSVQAYQIRDLSKAYNNASALIESNFHGFHTIATLDSEGHSDIILRDQKNKNLGWNTNKQSKESLYVELADLAKEGDMVINDNDAYSEIQSIEKVSLSAPKGFNDDRAMAYALAQMARLKSISITPLKVYDLEWKGIGSKDSSVYERINKPERYL